MVAKVESSPSLVCLYTVIELEAFPPPPWRGLNESVDTHASASFLFLLLLFFIYYFFFFGLNISVACSEFLCQKEVAFRSCKPTRPQFGSVLLVERILYLISSLSLSFLLTLSLSISITGLQIPVQTESRRTITFSDGFFYTRRWHHKSLGCNLPTFHPPSSHHNHVRHKTRQLGATILPRFF